MLTPRARPRRAFALAASHTFGIDLSGHQHVLTPTGEAALYKGRDLVFQGSRAAARAFAPTTPALLPVAGWINHAVESNCHLYVDVEEAQVVFVTTRRVEAGEEVSECV